MSDGKISEESTNRSWRSLVERMDAMETTYRGWHVCTMRREGGGKRGGLIASRETTRRQTWKSRTGGQDSWATVLQSATSTLKIEDNGRRSSTRRQNLYPPSPLIQVHTRRWREGGREGGREGKSVGVTYGINAPHKVK